MSQDVSLPALKINYSGLPKRYEETKPVFIQGFTHQRIVGKFHVILDSYF